MEADVGRDLSPLSPVHPRRMSDPPVTNTEHTTQRIKLALHKSPVSTGPPKPVLEESEFRFRKVTFRGMRPQGWSTTVPRQLWGVEGKVWDGSIVCKLFPRCVWWGVSSATTQASRSAAHCGLARDDISPVCNRSLLVATLAFTCVQLLQIPLLRHCNDTISFQATRPLLHCRALAVFFSRKTAKCSSHWEDISKGVWEINARGIRLVHLLLWGLRRVHGA